MRSIRSFRAGLVAIAALVGATVSTAANAASGTISITIVKAGFFLGASGGSGTLSFNGRNYPLTIGGVSYGFTFGASETRLYGRVTHINRASDVAGVYGAAGAGAAAGNTGGGAIILTNTKGAVLELQGRQRGLIVSADFSGMAISLR